MKTLLLSLLIALPTQVQVEMHPDDEVSVACVNFVLNSLSKEKTITKQDSVNGIMTINLEDYSIDPIDWAWLEERYPYEGTIRSDWFIANALQEPYYSKLLGIAKAEDFYKLVGDPNIHQRFSAMHNGYKITRLPTTNRSLWTLSLLNADSDELQLYGFLPNGFLAYLITNKDGNKITTCDVRTFAHNGREVKLANSCVACHVNHGIIRDYRREDNKIYLESLRKATGRDQIAYTAVVDKYYSLVTLDAAATELGISRNKMELLCKTSGDLDLLLLLTRGLRREHWGTIYKTTKRSIK